jgi:type IV pilus assembly protein PilV
MNYFYFKLKYHQRGFTLLEVVIAAFVLSVGLLGVAGLQGISLKMTQGSYLRGQAVNLAYEITDAMRANKAKAGDYAKTIPSTCNTALAYSWTTPIAAADLAIWGNRLACLLPNGSGTIAQAGDLFTITVTWNETRFEGQTADAKTADAKDTYQSFSFTTEL